jgi:hypothetical protein
MRQELNLPKTTPRQDEIQHPGTETKTTIRSILPRIKTYLRGVERINPQDSSNRVSKVDSAALPPRHVGGQPR